MKISACVTTAAVVSLLFGLSPAWAEWDDLNGPLNSGSAFATSLAVDGSVPVVALADPDGSGNGGIYVKTFDGSNWLEVGTNPINATGEFESANAPAVAVDGEGNLYTAWQQDNSDTPPTRRIFVKWNDGSGWADKGTNPLNSDPANLASAPDLALAPDGTPYVVWHEDNGSGITQIFVKKHNGADWEWVGTNPINHDPAHSAQLASIAVDGAGNPFVAWHEEDGSDPPVSQIFVKTFSPAKTGWTLVGTDNPLNKSAASNAYAPRVAFNGAVPYVTWHEQDPAYDLKTKVYVKSYDSVLDQWAFVGSGDPLNLAADRSAYAPPSPSTGTGTPSWSGRRGSRPSRRWCSPRSFPEGPGGSSPG